MQPPPAAPRVVKLEEGTGQAARHSKDFSSRRSWLGRAALAAASAWIGDLSRPLVAAERSSQWPFEVTAGLFRIHADFEISAKAELLSELDRLSGDVTKLLELNLPQTMVHVVIFSSAEEYRRYMAHYYPALPERRALFIQQRGTGMLFAHRHADLATDLRHETVHAILNDRTDPLPLWLDEGLAEYFEVPAADRWSGHTHLIELQALEGHAPRSNLETLEALEQVSGMRSEHYRDAWSWIHFLLHRRMSTRRILVAHLRQLRAARPAPPLSRTIAAQIPNWREEFSDHFQRVPSVAKAS